MTKFWSFYLWRKKEITQIKKKKLIHWGFKHDLVGIVLKSYHLSFFRNLLGIIVFIIIWKNLFLCPKDGKKC